MAANVSGKAMLDAQQVDCLLRIENLARTKGIGLYVVGGIVRDLLRKAAATDCDLDILVDGNAIDFASEAQHEIGGTLKIFKDFCTAKILNLSSFSDIEEIDFASARTEVYKLPGALPTVSLAPLAEDLRRRDFSVNAMALPLSVLIDFSQSRNADRESLVNARIDPFDGFTDLENRQIRVLHDKSFIDDPTRLFRAIRYKVRIGGEFEKETARLLSDAIRSHALSSISIRRKFNELNKVFAESDIIECVEDCIALGLIREAFSHPDLELNQTDLERVLRAAAFFLLSGEDPGQFEILLIMLVSGAINPAHRTLFMQQLSVTKTVRAVCESDVAHAEKNDSSHRFSKEGDAYRKILRKAMSAAE